MPNMNLQCGEVIENLDYFLQRNYLTVQQFELKIIHILERKI